MKEIIKFWKGYKLIARWIYMGNDLCVTLTGGDLEHLGAVAVGVARPSLSGDGSVSSSVSVITLTGHKEDVIAKDAAAYLTSKMNKNVVVSVGIHIDDILPQMTSEIYSEIQILLEDIENAVTVKI